MNSKLTLTLEKEVIEVVKGYAKENGQIFSQIGENYFKLITINRRGIKPQQVSCKVQKIRGFTPQDKDFDHKMTLTE